MKCLYMSVCVCPIYPSMVQDWECQGAIWIFTIFLMCFHFCPASFLGFTSSSIDWGYPDNDDTFDIHEGIPPSGTDTQINFCCRNDNVVSQKIHLPVDTNFMLLSRFGKCQMVSS